MTNAPYISLYYCQNKKHLKKTKDSCMHSCFPHEYLFHVSYLFLCLADYKARIRKKLRLSLGKSAYQYYFYTSLSHLRFLQWSNLEFFFKQKAILLGPFNLKLV